MSSSLPRVQLRDVAQPVTRTVIPAPGEFYRQLGVRLWGQGAYEREPVDGGLTKYQQIFRAEVGDIVVNKIWARNGSIAVVDAALSGCHGSNEFPMFAPMSGVLDSRWLHWITKTKEFWGQCDRKSQGTSGQNRIKPEQFLDIEIPLPAIEEQRRIIARIETLISKVEDAKKLRQSAVSQMRPLIQSSLSAIFDGESESHRWPSVALPSVATIARGKFAHRPRNDPRFYGGETPFIQIGDISASNRYIKSHSQTLNDDGVGISRVFPAGTVAIAITGATIGVTGILTYPCAFPDSIVGIEAKAEFATPEFIYLAVEHAKKKALNEATQTTQPNINLGNLERLQVRIPSMSVQREAVQRYTRLCERMDEVESAQRLIAQELQALSAAILDKAFKGEL